MHWQLQPGAAAGMMVLRIQWSFKRQVGIEAKCGSCAKVSQQGQHWASTAHLVLMADSVSEGG